MTKDMISFPLSNHEANLIDDFQDVGFGTAFNVKSNDQEKDKKRNISPRYVSFLKELRECGQFSRVEIHEGEPVSATRMTIGRFSGIKILEKLRFN